jgi:hypothetical protein
MIERPSTTCRDEQQFDKLEARISRLVSARTMQSFDDSRDLKLFHVSRSDNIANQ